MGWEEPGLAAEDPRRERRRFVRGTGRRVPRPAEGGPWGRCEGGGSGGAARREGAPKEAAGVGKVSEFLRGTRELLGLPGLCVCRRGLEGAGGRSPSAVEAEDEAAPRPFWLRLQPAAHPGRAEPSVLKNLLGRPDPQAPRQSLEAPFESSAIWEDPQSSS